MRRHHRLPFGAEIEADGPVRFRLWAPGARRVDLLLDDGGDQPVTMTANAEGWYEVVSDAARAGSRYRYLIDGELAVPDPASRFQPADIQGPSEVVAPAAFEWSDGDWTGRPWEETVLYELHVGTFTPEGSFAGVESRLADLAALGVTAIELMPLADFPGGRNWGYDGVLPFAPDSSYGRPEDLKRLVQEAHRHGLMVFLDVVYNHFGPDGNYLHRYAPQFFTERHQTPWGAAINFDSPGSPAVRSFYIENALYWLDEYNFDGLRFDAVHAIADDSRPDILEDIATSVRRRLASGRHVHLVLENDDNAARYLTRDGDGRPRHYTAQWNDDAHHAAHVLASGETTGYYEDYADEPARHFGRILTEGFAYQGEPSPHRDGKPRGEPSGGLPLTAFVNFLQNHDQIGNRAFGERIDALAPAAAVEAAVTALLLAPSPPLLFMGEEWAAPQPFLFFCDFHEELADAVRQGRRREFARFPQFQDEASRARIPDPNAPSTFERTRLDWADRDSAAGQRRLTLYRRLLQLRHQEIVPRLAGLQPGCATYTILSPCALQVTWQLGDGARLMLSANFGHRPVAGATPPAGACLFAADPRQLADLAGGELAPWSAIWHLQDHEGGR